MQQKLIIVAVVVVAIVITGAIVRTGERRAQVDGERPSSAIPRIAEEGSAVVLGDTQYVDIVARAGYSPRVTKATAGVPTVIRMKTENVYDCSTSVVIPDLSYQVSLRPSGVEEITVPLDKTQGTLNGFCSMGMYQFSVVFEESAT